MITVLNRIHKRSQLHCFEPCSLSLFVCLFFSIFLQLTRSCNHWPVYACYFCLFSFHRSTKSYCKQLKQLKELTHTCTHTHIMKLTCKGCIKKKVLFLKHLIQIELNFDITSLGDEIKIKFPKQTQQQRRTNFFCKASTHFDLNEKSRKIMTHRMMNKRHVIYVNCPFLDHSL